MKDKETKSRLARERIWTLLSGAEDHTDRVAALCERLRITPLTARLLCNRGYADPASAALFLANDERVWHDPMLMADMDVAVKRVLEAIEKKEGSPSTEITMWTG